MNWIAVTLHEPSRDDMTLAASVMNSFCSSIRSTIKEPKAILRITMDVNGAIMERCISYYFPYVIDPELEYEAYLQSKAKAFNA